MLNGCYWCLIYNIKLSLIMNGELLLISRGGSLLVIMPKLSYAV